MTGYILLFLYFAVFLYFLKKLSFFKNVPGLTYNWIIIFFSLKVISGIALSLIYKYYYDPQTSDIYRYFDDGLYLYSVFWKNPVDFFKILTGIGISQEHVDLYLSNMSHWFRPWEAPLYNDNRVVIRFNAIVGLFSFGHLHVHTVFANIVSFTGLVALYKFFIKYMPKEKIIWLKWGIFLFPSLLFWGSGVLKEAVLIGCFGVSVYLADYLLMYKKIFWGKILLLVACLWILLLLKPYILVLFLPCFAGFYISKNNNFLKTQLNYILSFSFLLILAIILHYAWPEYSPINLLARKQNDFINLAIEFNAGSLIHVNYLKPDLLDILRNAPQGFLTTLLRPHILEADTLFTLFASLENMLILLLLIVAFVIPPNLSKQPPITYISLWFFLAGFTFIGITTPISGAIVRYKIVMLPFLWVFIVNLMKPSLTKRSKTIMNLAKRSRDRREQ